VRAKSGTPVKSKGIQGERKPLVRVLAFRHCFRYPLSLSGLVSYLTTSSQDLPPWPFTGPGNGKTTPDRYTKPQTANPSPFTAQVSEGHRIDNLLRYPKVCLTVVGKTGVLSEELPTACESVVVFGEATSVDGEEKGRLSRLSSRSAPLRMRESKKR
jgi:hypothetical protein